MVEAVDSGEAAQKRLELAEAGVVESGWALVWAEELDLEWE